MVVVEVVVGEAPSVHPAGLFLCSYITKGVYGRMQLTNILDRGRVGIVDKPVNKLQPIAP